MATTNYTSLLGLALPTQGDLSGSWGDEVNNAITSLLDGAVAGTATLSTDANVTLTTTNGAANQARQAILLCTGARTAARTITAPAKSKAYVVINATTGGFAVNLVGAGPTTGISVAAGTSALVAWNGSDFIVVKQVAGSVVGTTDTQTLTNKTIDAASNTLTGVVTLTGTQTLTNKTLDAATNTLTGTQSGLTVGTAEAVSSTIASGAVGTTQAANDNSTKIATTAYADRAASNVIVAQLQPISASVGSNALTISASALSLDFRSTTLGSGTVTKVTGTPSNLVISSGSTLGTVSAQQSRIAVLAINNAGTIELAAVNLSGGNQLDETNLITTTAEGGAGAADSANVIYSATARSSVAYRVIGYIESTQTTAGTWATAPSTIQGQGGQALAAMSSLGYGQTWQNVKTTPGRVAGTTYYNTTGKPIMVNVSQAGTSSANFNVNGVLVAEFTSANIGEPYQCLVPHGASYVLSTATGQVISYWTELR